MEGVLIVHFKSHRWRLLLCSLLWGFPQAGKGSPGPSLFTLFLAFTITSLFLIPSGFLGPLKGPCFHELMMTHVDTSSVPVHPVKRLEGRQAWTLVCAEHSHGAWAAGSC